MNSENLLDQRMQDLMKGYRIGQLYPGFKCELTGTCLGRGGQCTIGVYEGIDRVTNKRYAIKRLDLKDDVACDTSAEVYRMKGLQHENLVRYYGIDIGSGTGPEVWIVMELCPAGSLRDLAKKGLQPSRVIDYAEQILSGLECLHLALIVHRDLKGHNVLIGLDGKIKLADFGLSKQLQNTRTITGEIETDAGTWRYMAPEAMNPNWARIGRRSDMWSFGCVLIDMITKREPRYAVDKDDQERVTNRNQAIFFIGQGNRPNFEITAFSGTYSKMQIQLLTTMMDKCLQAHPDQRATASELLKSMKCIKKPSYIPAVTNSSESSIRICQQPVVVDYCDTIARLTSWSLEEKATKGKENFGTTSLLTETAASTSVCLQKMLANATNTGSSNVGRYRSLPFKFPHYIMVDVNQNLLPQRVIMQYVDDLLAKPRQPMDLTCAILYERQDSELHQYQKNVKMGLEVGTMESLEGREYHTLIVWPNGPAAGLDKLTTKKQLEEVFSIKATQLIIVIQSKTLQAGAGEITTRSKWRFLIQDAQEAKRLLQM